MSGTTLVYLPDIAVFGLFAAFIVSAALFFYMGYDEARSRYRNRLLEQELQVQESPEDSESKTGDKQSD